MLSFLERQNTILVSNTTFCVKVGHAYIAKALLEVTIFDFPGQPLCQRHPKTLHSSTKKEKLKQTHCFESVFMRSALV